MRIESLFEKKSLSRIFTTTFAVCIAMAFSVLPIKAETGDTGDEKNSNSASSGMEYPDMRKPVAEASISLDYGETIAHPYTKKPYTHQGVDLVASLGKPVTAAGAGRVVETGFDKEKGNYIFLDHAGGLSSFYSHLKEILVQPNQELALGEKIGLLGNTGISTGPHVHFQLELNGIIVNPHAYMHF